MDIQTDISSLLIELDNLRVARGLSYQAMEDSCGISKSTVCRILNGQTEPTVQQLQSIAAAVQYKPVSPVIVPDGCNQDAYIAYLKELLQHREAENDRRIRQLQAHYNMLHKQDRRTIVIMGAILGLLVAAFILWLIIDVTHPDIGWFQR